MEVMNIHDLALYTDNNDVSLNLYNCSVCLSVYYLLSFFFFLFWSICLSLFLLFSLYLWFFQPFVCLSICLFVLYYFFFYLSVCLYFFFLSVNLLFYMTVWAFKHETATKMVITIFECCKNVSRHHSHSGKWLSKLFHFSLEIWNISSIDENFKTLKILI